MTYAPQPGTIAAKVIEYLRTQPPGAVIASAPLLEAIGHSDISAGLKPFVERAVAEGLIKIEKRPGDRLAYWRLGDGVPLARTSEDDDQAGGGEPAARPARKRGNHAKAQPAPREAKMRATGPDVPTIDEIWRFGVGFGVGVAVRLAERALQVRPAEARQLLADAGETLAATLQSLGPGSADE